jgi:hypothetical protein
MLALDLEYEILTSVRVYFTSRSPILSEDVFENLL